MHRYGKYAMRTEGSFDSELPRISPACFTILSTRAAPLLGARVRGDQGNIAGSRRTDLKAVELASRMKTIHVKLQRSGRVCLRQASGCIKHLGPVSTS
jgi:hypothetical protein